MSKKSRFPLDLTDKARDFVEKNCKPMSMNAFINYILEKEAKKKKS